jgi:hypothetical protein
VTAVTMVLPSGMYGGLQVQVSGRSSLVMVARR